MASHEIRTGAFHLPGFLTPAQQDSLARECLQLGEHAAGFYQPTLRSGAKMRLHMMCLGWHWNAKTYRYEQCRTDVDHLRVQPLPPAFAALAQRAARAVGMDIRADVCLVNWYEAEGRLGLHQDKDETPATITAGIPVVSFSIGDRADFLFGGIARRDPRQHITLRSGDAFVFGGAARLCFHGINRVFPNTAPARLPFTGRINLTLRQYLLTT
jgi:DNA oxidative demethylase